MESHLLKVKDSDVQDIDHLYRDPKSNAIINTNMSELQKARAFKKAREEQAEKIDNLEKEIKELKEMMNSLMAQNKEK